MTSNFVHDGLVVRKLIVRAKDVVFVKGIIDAHDGLAHVFSENGGNLEIAAAPDRETELDAMVRDLARELDGIVENE
jgi:hypothetical protein